jgi:uncharacterized membrane protein YhaH (DUF805 family)
MFSYLQGRSGRKEYWIGVALLLAVGVGLAYANVGGAGAATTFLWILVWNRRLHDIGQSGWVILIPLGLIIVAAVVGVALGGGEILNAFQYSEKGSGPVTERGAWLFVGLVLVLIAIQFGFTIWLGVKKGDPGANLFGRPPASF